MGRRKGEGTTAAKRRRMPFVAKIKREDPCCPEDTRQIETMCRLIAAASEWASFAGWHEEHPAALLVGLRPTPRRTQRYPTVHFTAESPGASSSNVRPKLTLVRAQMRQQ